MDRCHSHRLGPTLGWAARMSKGALDEQLASFDVTPAQTRLLMDLHRRGGQALQKDLTESMCTRAPTVNGILDRLEEKGMVRRSVSGADARQRVVTLTDKGRERQTRFAESYLAVEDRMVRGFTEEERAALLSYLDRVIGNLQVKGGESHGPQG